MAIVSGCWSLVSSAGGFFERERERERVFGGLRYPQVVWFVRRADPGANKGEELFVLVFIVSIVLIVY